MYADTGAYFMTYVKGFNTVMGSWNSIYEECSLLYLDNRIPKDSLHALAIMTRSSPPHGCCATAQPCGSQHSDSSAHTLRRNHTQPRTLDLERSDGSATLKPHGQAHTILSAEGVRPLPPHDSATHRVPRLAPVWIFCETLPCCQRFLVLLAYLLNRCLL